MAPKIPILTSIGLIAMLAGCAGPPAPAPVAPAPAPAPAPPQARARSGPACLAELSQAGAGFTNAAQPGPPGPCVIDTPVRATNLGIALVTPVTMSCGLAEAMLRFDHEVMQPTALRLLGQNITGLRHFGAFACRNEVSNRPGHLSQHALGRAFDLSGMILKDGSSISVEKDWTADGPRGRFLHAIAAAACGYFSVVLTPATNAFHHDHLHLDIGPERYCGDHKRP